jgi:hypothetical protein
MLGATVTRRAPRRGEREALDGKLTSANTPGVDTGRLTTSRSERPRPCQWAPSVQRAIALIDQTADPQLAAIIALSLVYRHPETIRRVNVGGVAANGTTATTSWA